MTLPERLPTDDILRRIHSLFLGFKGYTFWWRARFVAYLVGAIIAVLCVLVEDRLGIRSPLLFFGMLGLATWQGTTRIMRFVNFDVSIWALVAIVWHEISAPRPAKPIRQTVTVKHVKVDRERVSCES